MESVCPKYLNEVAVVRECTTDSALLGALYGPANAVGIQ